MVMEVIKQAIFGEKADVRATYTVVCNGCGVRGPSASARAAMEKKAHVYGWKPADGVKYEWYCPKCGLEKYVSTTSSDGASGAKERAWRKFQYGQEAVARVYREFGVSTAEHTRQRRKLMEAIAETLRKEGVCK